MTLSNKVRSKNAKRLSILGWKQVFGINNSASHSTIRLFLGIAVLSGVLPVEVRAQASNSAATSEQSRNRLGVLQDYIYGYAPVALEATRDLLTAVPDATTMAGFAPINQFARQNKLVDPNETLIVRPNADTLYTNAWLDLRAEPMILHVPTRMGDII
jgi:hypothetical protein